MSVFVSASETHNARNVNRTVAESLTGLRRVLARAAAAGLRGAAIIATSFGCPYEGVISEARVMQLARELVAAGATEIGFGDTTGMANPAQVGRFFVRAASELGGDVELTAHFHNTRGQGLANALPALQAGCTSFECASGELGGRPVPPGATGNVATEDLVSMLHEMGVATGIDLSMLLDAAQELAGVLAQASRRAPAGRWRPCPTGSFACSRSPTGSARARPIRIRGAIRTTPVGHTLGLPNQ